MNGSRIDFDELLRTCIHCGLCLNECPTYRLTGDEAHSPRGRIMALRQLIEPQADERWDPGRESIDMCLGCRGCETACPSGVPYGRLLEEGRGRLPDPVERLPRLVRLFTRHVIPRRRLLAVMAMAGSLFSRWRVTTGSLARLLSALPRRRATWPRIRGPRTGEVAVLAGCAQPVFSPGVLPATLAIIRASGARPFVPHDQGCCGALAAHAGDLGQARSLGRDLIRALEAAEAVVIPSAGCSAHITRLDELFEDDAEWGPRARALADKAEDFVIWVYRNRKKIDWRGDRRRIVFQRPCHLRHAQGVNGVAEELLLGISGVELLDTPRPDLCCGSAGAWSLEYPELAQQRRREKMADLLGPGPELILTANPGCELFLDGGPEGVAVRHLAEYLAGLLPRS